MKLQKKNKDQNIKEKKKSKEDCSRAHKIVSLR